MFFPALKSSTRLCTPALMLMLIAACSPENTPEDSVKQFIADIEIALEAGDMKTVREHIAEDYADESGRSKTDLQRYVMLQLLKRKSIHLYTSISDTTFPTQETAKVELLTAMTGTAAESKNVLLDTQADVYRFNFALRQNNDSWLLTTATWEPATLDDLLAD
jgi:hypothetical protein